MLRRESPAELKTQTPEYSSLRMSSASGKAPAPSDLSPEPVVNHTLEITEQKLMDVVASDDGVHGKVKKVGMLSKETWMFPFSGEQVLENWLWDELLMKEHILESYDHDPQPPKAGLCNALFNPVYKFIFVRNPKVAGQALFAKFGRYCAKDMSLENAKESPNCMWTAEMIQNLGLKKLGYASWEELWADYTVVTLIRNPFDRAGSAYDYLLGRREEDSENCRAPSFEHFTATPYVLGVQDKVYGCQDYLHDLWHVQPQAPCLVDENENFAVDYIIRSEALDDDLQPFLDTVNANRFKGTPALEGGVMWINQGTLAQEATGGDKTAVDKLKKTKSRHVQKYTECGSTCVANVQDYYKEDFQTLKYPTAM